ncbi:MULTISPECIES: acyl carrier protein [Brevibacillus]|uniref:Acyl carrier protein n=1 Tax=Brevibacillus brevis TaxID=1393 RepID=A0A2Z4MIW4_BREBE|nr:MULTISPECIES: phosphopantetheine-binding protein [Brevibacillus]AWX56418.1 acyl carrier protein [Brevibacillus brevis]NRR24236.1 acyl carrier protein [Brevibacillus sp. MS2.2]
MITKNEIEEKLVNIYMKQMQELQISPDNLQQSGIDFSSQEIRLQDVGINSLGFIRLVVAVENEFGFQFEDDMLNVELFQTIQELITYIEGKVKQESI